MTNVVYLAQRRNKETLLVDHKKKKEQEIAAPEQFTA